MKKLKVMSIFGTRPEGIKMAPVVLELRRRHEIESFVVVTAQHREMLDQVIRLFDFSQDVDLDIMAENQTLTDITTRALRGLESVMKKERPDAVVVQGDTTTAFVAALAAFYEKIPVGHVEAGLRTNDKYSPYPEEMNRRLITSLGDMHFAPTVEARENLRRCGVEDSHIYLTGNTVVDALYHILKVTDTSLPHEVEQAVSSGSRILFVETHRRENLGKPMEDICRALKKLVEDFSDVEVVFSVHKNPLVRNVVFKELSGIGRVHLLEPLDYPVMVKVLEKSHIVLTDSGGLQEESPSLGKPVLVLRKNTERPEGVAAGTARLVGTDEQTVFEEAKKLLEDPGEYGRMSNAVNPYGDGNAAVRTVDAILHYCGIRSSRPRDFLSKVMAHE